MGMLTGWMRPSMGTREVQAGTGDVAATMDGRQAGPMNDQLTVLPSTSSGDPRGSADRQVVDTSGRGVVLGPRQQRRATTVGAPNVDRRPAAQNVSFVKNLSASTGVPEQFVFFGLLILGAVTAFSVIRKVT